MKIDENLFKDPKAEYRVFQYVQGHKIHIEKMLKMHLGGGVCGVNWGDDYLKNDESWETLAGDLKRAKEAGLVTWIFDEKGYPSGCAGGLTVEGRPELEARGIYLYTVEGNGIKQTAIPLPEGAERFIHAWLFPCKDTTVDFENKIELQITDGGIETEGIEGDWKVYAVAEKIMFDGTHAYLMKKTWKATGHYPNLMDREAVRRFIDITYEEYKQRIGDSKDDIFAFYTNEPSLMTHWVENSEPRPNGECYAPWEKTIPERFLEKFGFDLLPHLYQLFTGDDESSKVLRYHYYTIVGDLMTENFSGQLSDWCEENNTCLSGHILCEEYMAQHVPLFGDFMRVIGRFSVPGADMAIRPHGKDRTDDIMGLKYVSSAARIYGKQKVQTLMDPILGGYYKDNQCEVIPLKVLLNNLNLLFYCGINVITTYGSWEQHPVEDYVQYNTYAGRLAVVLREAVDRSQTAIYYPIETFQGRYIPSAKYIHSEHFDYSDIENPQIEIVKRLIANNIDFNYINADSILGSSIENSILKTEKHYYKTIIVPATEIMEVAVAEKLNEFIVQGGKVIFTDSVPNIAANVKDTARLQKIFASCKAVESYGRVIAQIDEISDYYIDFVSDRIQVARFIRNSKNLLFLMNQTDSQQTAILNIKGTGEVKVYNPENGTITEQPLPSEIKIGSSLSLIIEY
jgi:hypothetical protein